MKYKVPDGWVVEIPPPVCAQSYKLPKLTGRYRRRNLVLYYFGKDREGQPSDIDRWINQMTAGWSPFQEKQVRNYDG